MVKVEAYEVPEGLYYSKDFEWIKIEGDKVRMGITDYAQKSLREIVYAELPSRRNRSETRRAVWNIGVC